MFKTIFTKLCNQRGESPTAVCLKVGLSNSAYTAWNEDSVPRLSTLLKIADYFGVSTDYLLGRESATSPFTEKTGGVEMPVLDTVSGELTERELRLVMAYRQKDDVRHVVDKLLDVAPVADSAFLYRAADSDDRHPDEVVCITDESVGNMKQTPETEDSLL